MSAIYRREDYFAPRSQREGRFAHIKVDRSSKPIGWSVLSLSMLAFAVLALVAAVAWR